MTIELINGSGEIYEISNTAGAGLGKFMEYFALSFPNLMLDLMFVMVILVIAFAIVSVIKHNGIK